MLGIMARSCSPGIRQSNCPVYAGFFPRSWKHKNWPASVYGKQLLLALKRCPFVVPIGDVQHAVAPGVAAKDKPNGSFLVRCLLASNAPQAY